MCSISINQPTAVVSGSTINSITVVGTTTSCNCLNVTVTIKCLSSTGTPSSLIVPVVSGNFTATFTGAALLNCFCEKEILVSVQCDDHPAQSQGFRLDCNPCSDIRVVGLPDRICTNDPFQFQIANGSSGTVNVNIDFGDGTSLVVPGVGSTLVTVPIPAHIYTSPNTYTITIWITGCPPQQYTVVVADCPVDCCPNAVAVITSEIKEECNADQTKNVKIDAVITPTPRPGCPTNIQAEMWIDNNLEATGSGSSTFTLSHQGDYKCGDHNVVIKYLGSKCPDSGGTFCVSVCETRKCKKRRFSFAVAATVALISLLLYVFNSAYTILAGLSTAFMAVAVINFIRWRPCDQICKKCPRILAIWQIALATFIGLIMLSKSSFIVIYGWLVAAFAFAGTFAPVLAILVIILIILIIILIIYLLYKNWVAKCCPTKCEQWTMIKESFLDICAIAFAIVGGVILSFYGYGVVSLFWIPYATIVWALIVWWVKIKKIDACAI